MDQEIDLPLDSETKAEAAAIETQQFRSQVGHISRQSGIFFAGTLFTAALGYVFKVYLARVLGPEALGVYALGITLIGFVGIFNTLGLNQSAVRFVPLYCAAGKFDDLHSFLWRGGFILLAANIGVAAILLIGGPFVAARFYHSAELAHFLPLFVLLMLPSVLTNFYGKVLAGYKDLGRRTLIVSFIGSPLVMLATVVLVALGMGLRGYLIAQIFSGLVVLALLLAAVRELTPAAARFSASSARPLEPAVWSLSSAMLGLALMEFFASQVDRIALGFYSGARAVGIYSVAAAMVAYVSIVLHSVNQIFSATISDLHTRGDHALLARLFQSLTKWVVGLTLPVASVLIIFARPIMRIFGSDFEAGWPILVIGTFGQLVNCGVGSVGYLLLMSGNQKRLLKVQAVMAVVMVALNIALVPGWGLMGAAVAAAITNAGTNAWNLIEVRRALGLSPYNRSYVRLLPPAIAMLGATALLKRNSGIFHHDWLAVGATGVAAYLVFGAVALAFGLDDDDRLIAHAIWSRISGAFPRMPTKVEP